MKNIFILVEVSLYLHRVGPSFDVHHPVFDVVCLDFLVSVSRDPLLGRVVPHQPGVLGVGSFRILGLVDALGRGVLLPFGGDPAKISINFYKILKVK